MPSRAANTPIELWPKTINSLTDIKLSVAENGMQKYSRDLQKAISIESDILRHLNEPVEQIISPGGPPGGAPPGMGGPPPGMAPSPGVGIGGPGPPGSPSRMGPSPFGGGPPGASVAPGPPAAPPPVGVGAPGGAPNPDELRRLLST